MEVIHPVAQRGGHGGHQGEAGRLQPGGQGAGLILVFKLENNPQ